MSITTIPECLHHIVLIKQKKEEKEQWLYTLSEIAFDADVPFSGCNRRIDDSDTSL